MIERPKTTLNYSTDAVEHDIDRIEQERRRHLEDYNEATFGDRQPWLAGLKRFVLTTSLGIVVILILPRGIGDLFGMAFVVLFQIWLESRR